MENKNPNIQPVNQEEADFVAKTKKYRKQLTALFVAVAVILVAILAWFLVRQSQVAKADQAIALADVEQNDSIALNLYKDAAAHGTKSGDRAKIETAIRLYQAGNYEEAVKYLDDASASDEIIAAGIETLKGDCYVNLQNYDAAIKAYEKAVKEANHNSQLVPIILVKEANVYREQKNYAAEAKAYGKIVEEYPTYGEAANLDIRKYYERAKAAAAE
ncbi:MAG: tetratricopeptide repeat protein [Muribaculaceae bacterium]|nr:tetratricopeptide repeat protein [Muribaculaceae bacterium]MDE5594217.1 tetratricopeptide repeat protein [Muribaculaceae bacterium]